MEHHQYTLGERAQKLEESVGGVHSMQEVASREMSPFRDDSAVVVVGTVSDFVCLTGKVMSGEGVEETR